ncbi:MAG: hypothetical protein ACKOCN_03295, partial [Planctomycetaceae bacterium]
AMPSVKGSRRLITAGGDRRIGVGREGVRWVGAGTVPPHPSGGKVIRAMRSPRWSEPPLWGF